MFAAQDGRDSSEAVSVLLIDDDETYLRALLRGLAEHFPEPSDTTFLTTNTASHSVELCKTLRPAVVILDLSLDDCEGPESGLNLIGELLNNSPQTRIIVLTGHRAKNIGIEALKRGASSFLAKPVDTLHLAALIKDGISYAQLSHAYELLSLQHNSRSTVFLTNNSRMKQTLEKVAYAASNDIPILLHGETGTGKGILASAIHQNSAIRNKYNFVRFQPNFSNHDLVNSELFGHKRGAFTGATEERKGLLEAAHRGTLFIDEVDELPLPTQVILLNVLQEKVFRPVGHCKDKHSDFRLLSATNADLAELIKQRKIRPDFFHRIAHSVIHIPPLRERREDISLLAEHFFEKCVLSNKYRLQGFNQKTLELLHGYLWPGNIRELLGAVESACASATFHKRSYIDPTDFNLNFTTSSPNARLLSPLAQFGNSDAGQNISGQDFRSLVRQFEEKLVMDAMKLADENQTRAAEILRLDRSSLRRILARSQP